VTPFPKQLIWLTTALFAALCGVAAWLCFAFPAPQVEALVLLCALMVFSANREVRLANNMFVSPTSMVTVAAVVVFGHDQELLGVLAVGACAGLMATCFSRDRWGWLAFNGSLQGLAATGAALVYAALTSSLSESLPEALLPLAASTAVYVLVSWAILLSSYLVELRRVPEEVIHGLPQSILEVLPFAVLGFFLGRMYLALGPGVLVLIVVPIVIAREMFASYMRVKEAHEETVGMLIRALEAKDRYTSGHSERVATYARYMGERLNFMPARLERLRFAALMHDIGKLVVPNHLLNKPGRLTEEEFAKVRIHEKVSVQMLSHIDFLRPIAAASHSDATRFDPDDEDHPIEPYIVMIADAYDAMTSTRSYRKALPQEVAFQELRDKAGVQFHPACVEALITAIEARGEKHGAGHEVQAEFDNAPEAGLGSAGLGDLLPSDAAN
jgi:HD superfamily phosphodiesterase